MDNKAPNNYNYEVWNKYRAYKKGTIQKRRAERKRKQKIARRERRLRGGRK